MSRQRPFSLAAIVGVSMGLAIAGTASADSFARWPAHFSNKAVQAHDDAKAASTNAVDGSCLAIPDDAYDGQLGTMMCRSTPGLAQTVSSLTLKLGVNHPFVGDLVVKVVNPAGQIVTVLDRPGLAETVDDGSSCCGDGSGLSSAAPIEFDDTASASAESMGSTLGDSLVICRDGGDCRFRPDAGAAAPGTLSDFVGSNGAGTWKVCVGDAESLQTGSLCSASLIFNGQDGDVGIVADFPDGTNPNAAFALRFTVTNHGPSAQTGVIATDSLPASLAYVSDDCGLTRNGSLLSWNIGAMGATDSRECHVSVRMSQSGTCSEIATTASVRSDVADSYQTNNTSTAQNGGDNLVADPGLETSGPNAGGIWSSTSTNFGAVFCAQGRCTDNPNETAFSGDWWAWFGGIDPTNTGGAHFPETASLSQPMMIPEGTDNLYFQLRMPVCSGTAADYLSLRIDGNEVWRTDATNQACGSSAYAQQAVNVSAYADSGSHTVEFVGVQTGVGGITAFFVDNVAFMAPLACSGGSLAGDQIFSGSFDTL